MWNILKDKKAIKSAALAKNNMEVIKTKIGEDLF